MATTATNPFDEKIKIFNYVQTLLKCSGDSDEVTYRKAIKDNDCRKTIATYFRQETYNRATPAPRRGVAVGTMAPQFVQAFFVALRYFKMLDPSTNTRDWNSLAAGVPLNNALLEIVYDIRRAGATTPLNDGLLAAAMTGGGDDFDFSKIIKLSKNEPEGFVPYTVNSIAGSYTDEYLDEMTSKIKKHFNQFGGFKKSTKDVIGSLEDLDRLLRDDMAKQVNDAVYKRYYKSYPMTYQTGGDYGEHGTLVKEAYDMYRAASTEQKEVIDCIGRFQFYKKTLVGAGPVAQYTLDKDKLNSEDPATLGDGFIRFNLKKLRDFKPDRYTTYINLVKSAANPLEVRGAAPVGVAPGGNFRSIPILLLMLPDSFGPVLGTAFNYWYGLPGQPGAAVGNHLESENGGHLGDTIAFSINGAVPLRQLQGTADDVIVQGCKPLAAIMSCDDDLFNMLVANKMPDGEEGEYQFRTKYDDDFVGIDKNRYRYDSYSKRFQRKNSSGQWETIDPVTDKKKYKEFFNTDDKCFNSYFRTTTSEQCCDAMKMLMEGKTTDFIKAVGNNTITFGDFDRNFKELNPYSVVKFLEGFKFPIIKEYSPIHGTVNKFPNYRWWEENTLKTLSELNSAQKTTIKGIPLLKEFLDMSVSFVNNNINILNPQIDSMESSSSKDAALELRNVHRFVPVRFSPMAAEWYPLRKKVLGNMMKINSLSPALPFGMLFGGQQFTAHIGGGNKSVEVVLDDFEIRPTFASQIAEDLKAIINNLKNNNKFLRSKEMEDINEQLNNYAKLEVELYERILLINKYIKIAYLLNDNDRETLSNNTIKTKIAEYLEYFKDYSGKDMELKNLGSVLRSMINDKL